MSWSIDRKKVKSINEGGRKLKVGTFAYKITDARSVVDKQDPKGKRQQVLFGLTLKNDPGYSCQVYLSVMSENDQQREIAQGTLAGFADAAGIGGILKPERMKSFIGKIVVIEAKETAGKGENSGKTYVNVKTVEAYEEDADDADDSDADDDTDDDSDDSDDDSDDADDSDDDDSDDSDDDSDDNDDDGDADPEPEVTPPPAKRKPSAAAKFAAEEKAQTTAVSPKKFPWGKPKA